MKRPDSSPRKSVKEPTFILSPLTQITELPTFPAIMYADCGRLFGGILAAWLLAAQVLGQVDSWQASGDPLPQPGVLVLRNGQILEGKITRAGDLFYVVVPDGEIRVSPAQVEFSCRNLDEAYLKKRAAIHTGDVHAHLQLAQWCQRQGLVDAAVRELDEAAAADPTHPMIELLRRRLLMSATSAEVSAKSSPAPGRSAPSVEELARLARELPSGSVEAFSRTIQPLLVNGCTTSGCHSARSDSAFHLLRNRPGSLPHQQMTQRNLHATLRWVDRQRPEASPLLTVLAKPHGGATGIYAEQHPAQHRQIAEWVCGLSEAKGDATDGHRASVPTTVGSHEALAVQAMSWGPAAGSAPAEKGTDDLHGEQADKGNTQGASGKDATQSSSVKRGQPPKQFVPIDPFDPEIFNRQFRAERGLPPEASAGGPESSSK